MAAPLIMVPLLLHEIHLAAGACFVEVNGQEAVAHYGDWLAEYQALRQAAAVLDLSFRGRLCLVGADAQKFLNGQVTNNVKDLKAGAGCYAALVSAKGKMESDLNIYRLENEMLLDFEPGLAARVTQRLEKFIIAEDAQVIDVAPDYGLLSVQGPEAAALLAGWAPGLAVPREAMAVAKTAGGVPGEIYVTHQARAGLPGFDLFVPAAAMRETAGGLQALGARWGGWEALETARVEAGVPRFGADMDETNLAPEAVEARAISYSKGCYIGQEVIARIRTYGQVAKALRGLRLGGEVKELPAKGAKIFSGEKDAGYVTSAVRSPRMGGVIALSYVRREANQLGAALLVETPGGRIPAQIVELPFQP
jgi:folate-binding protein YgfZ